MSRSYKCQRVSGFTLIEVLVALSITAFIGTVAYNAFYVAMDTGDSNLAKAREIKELDRAMVIIERDLQQAVGRSIVTGYDDQQSAFEGLPEAQYSSLDEYLLRLTRDGWHNPRQQHRSDLLRVGYRLYEGELWRDHWPHIELADEVAPTQLLLLSGVASMRLRYLAIDTAPTGGVSMQWQDQWPANLVSSAPGTAVSEAIPTAVEITFELEKWGEIKRLFMLPGS